MSLFYTGKGDAGSSDVGKKKIPKDSSILEVLGELDELNSLIGVTRSSVQDQTVQKKLKHVQEALFVIQARVAWIMFPEYPAKQLTQERIVELEQEIDAIEAIIQPERGFVISGEHATAAQLDYIRAVSRRVERKIDALHKEYPLAPEILAYMNRLSSYLYALARLEIFQEHIKESKPNYE
jgi:cob(I)alamin adenosyltransferase